MRARLLAATAGLALLAGAAAADARRGGAVAATAPRLELLAHSDPGTRGYDADVVLHRRHAYLSSHKGRAACGAEGVRVFSLVDPRRPKLISTFADGRSNPRLAQSWTEKTIVRRVRTPRFDGDLAVTSVQACTRAAAKGFALYDVTRPSAPKLLAFVPTDPRGSHEIWLATARGRAYVYTAIVGSEIRSSPAGARAGKPDFRIIDVTEPREPKQVGQWGAWRNLGIRPTRPGAASLNGNFVHSVITDAGATRAYLSYWDLGTVILDIRNPAQPRYLGRTRRARGDQGNAHSAWLGRGGRLLVETHETSGGFPTFHDVSRPARPVRLGRLRLPASVIAIGHRHSASDRVSGVDLTDSVHDGKIAGRYAFFSWYAQGVVVADIVNPRRPTLVARYLPRAEDDPERLLCPGTRCVAVWGVDVAGDLVVASDMVSGLWVLRLRR
jgi:hypothetical protein